MERDHVTVYYEANYRIDKTSKENDKEVQEQGLEGSAIEFRVLVVEERFLPYPKTNAQHRD